MGASGLYFEKSGFGKILFTNSLNVTDQSTRSLLVFLGNLLNIQAGRIGLDTNMDLNMNPITSEALQQAGAQLYMYDVNTLGIDELADISLDNIIAKDSDTNEILTGGAIPELTGLEYTADNS